MSALFYRFMIIFHAATLFITSTSDKLSSDIKIIIIMMRFKNEMKLLMIPVYNNLVLNFAFSFKDFNN